MEPLNLGEAGKSSRRRLSSILKAPRTSMKLLGTEPEEPKEEIVKPVEKRNSRRVSFATTNNIRVFTNDAKRESPVLASIQNTHVGDENICNRPDEKMLRFVDEGNHQIKGLETLLTTPLYLSQHRENFFSDPVLQDDCVDRTMLLGENTGYMDITHSHTITIDKDYEIEEEPIQDCSFKVAQKVCGDLNVASKKGSPSESKAECKNAATDPDFSAFLAGMCLPTVNIIKPPNSENELDNVSCSANTSTMEIDKENHLPSFLMKQHPGGKSNPKQPLGLQRRRSRVSFVKDDNMEETMSHTVIIENKYNAQPHAPSISEDQGSGAFMASAFSNISDDMDLTQSQTAAINVKVTGNITRNVQAALDHNRSHYFSEDEMEMMGPFDLKKDHTISTKAQSPITKTRRLSSFNVIGSEETADQNNTGYFQSNLSIAKTANSDDIETTGVFDISIRENEDSLFPKLSQISTYDALGNGEIVYQNKSGLNLSTNLTPTVNNDDMEMTLCPSSGNKPFSNSRKSIPLASLSRTVRKDEHAGIIKEDALHPILGVSKIACFNMVENEEKLDHNKSGHLLTSQTANYDDMEMTESQSIFFEAKQVSGDKPLSNSRKNWPHTSVSRTEDGDGKDITQALTGRIIQNALLATKERGESLLIPAATTSTERNESDCMDLTCQPSTFAGISPPSPDEVELTGCNTVNIDSYRIGLGSGDADLRRVPFSANQTVTVDETMEMTEVHMAPVSERKYKALMTRRKAEARMSLIFDPEYTEAENCQANYTNPDHMDMTQCQTVVLEAENSKLFSKSRKSLNLVSMSSIPDFDGMEITQALTGNIMLKSFASNKERRLEKDVLPTAQSCQRQDESNCMDLTCQVSASSLAMPCVDEMELTGCNTIAIDSKSTLAGSASEIKANENALWASTSVSKCTVSSEEQNEVSEAAKCAINYVFPSKHALDLDGKNLKCNNTETMSCDPADIQENKYTSNEMVHPSNVMKTDEKNDMQVTKILTVPVEIVSIDQRKENINTSSCSRYEEDGQALWSNKEQSTSSIQREGSSPNESVVDSFSKEEPQHAKARRRSLAVFQTELQNITRRIQEEQKVMPGSTTAPLPCAFPKISLKEQREIEVSSEPASIVTPNVKQKNYFQNEKTTPFSVKKPFSSRLSLYGIVPKLPKRSTTATPNKTVNMDTNDLPSLQLEKHFDVVEQINNCKMVNINDEECPEISSEEDLSGSLENWPVNKQDESADSLAIPILNKPFEDEVFEPATNTSPCFKRPRPEEDNITVEQTKKAYISEMGPDCHEAAVQWEGNFTGHAAQNPKAKTTEDTGVSESTIRYSQFDSHMDGTLDHVFDFNKKLEDGSITVNEFLSHFGIKFVIHRSRPSILPDSCRAGDTRTMEDLLKEKYIYHPKQRVYEQDCKNLTEIVDRLKEKMPEQEKSLECINKALLQQISTLSQEQLKSFGSKLKERKVYFGKRSKAHSHEMKGILYSELIKTTQDAKESLISKIKETDEMIEDLDGVINDLETELASVETTIMGYQLDAPRAGPFLKAKEEDLQRLNSAVTVKEREIDELEIQLKTVEGQQERLRGESSSLKSHLATLNSLNEWRLDATDERGALFTFLHNTVHLQVNLQKPAGKEWMTEDVEQNIDVCFQLQLDVGKSECHASMVHKLLALYCQSQAKWAQRYPTTRHIPELLHDISLVVARLRLLGEEIHRLKKWGGLKLRILKITCMDTRVHIVFSSLKAFEKFELSLMVTPDYPFGPLHIQDFKKHTGNTRLSQIEDILSSVKPAKNYLTKVLKKIHDDLLC